MFFLAGGGKKEELARLKGEYEALQRVAIEKNCNFAGEMTPPEGEVETAEEAAPSS